MKKLFTVVALIGLSVSVAACGPYQLNAIEASNAKLSAYETADRVSMDLSTVMNQDSDKDGYVTATFKDRKPPNAFVDFLCPYRQVGQCRPKPTR